MTDWPRLYRGALGTNQHFGVGYQDNFRAGRIGRKNAALIAAYVLEKFPSVKGRMPTVLLPETVVTTVGAAAPAQFEYDLQALERHEDGTYAIPADVGTLPRFSVWGPFVFRIRAPVQATVAILRRDRTGWLPVPVDGERIAAPLLANEWTAIPSALNMPDRQLAEPPWRSFDIYIVLAMIPELARPIMRGWFKGEAVPHEDVEDAEILLALNGAGKMSRVQVRTIEDHTEYQIRRKTWKRVKS